MDMVIIVDLVVMNRHGDRSRSDDECTVHDNHSGSGGHEWT